MERAVVEQERRREALPEFMLAQLTAAVVNHLVQLTAVMGSRSMPDPVRVERFMPSRRREVDTTPQRRKRTSRAQEQQIANGVRAFFRQLRPQAGGGADA